VNPDEALFEFERLRHSSFDESFLPPEGIYGSWSVPKEFDEARRRPTVVDVDAFDPAGFDVVAETCFLELPYDLQFPSQTGFVGFCSETSPVSHWSDAARGRLISQDSLPPRVAAEWVLRFRRALVHTTPPNLAADFAYSEWIRPCFDESAWAQRNATLRDFEVTGLPTIRTVVASTQFYSPEEWPRNGFGVHEHLSAHVDTALTRVNKVVTSISVASSSKPLREVSRGELPAVCPFLIDAVNSDGWGITACDVIPIHENVDLPAPEPLSSEVVAAVSELFHREQRDGHPYFQFFRTLNQAIHYQTNHRWWEAIVTCGTAVEVFVSALLNDAGAQSTSGSHPPKFAERLRDELPMIVDPPFRDEISRVSNSWLSGGYKTRNRCVHEGFDPDDTQAHEVLSDAFEFFQGVRNALISCARTHELGLRIEMEFNPQGN
jgi:hypothetical protein